MYRSAGYIEHIPHIFICAGWQKGGRDSCEGENDFKNMPFELLNNSLYFFFILF